MSDDSGSPALDLDQIRTRIAELRTELQTGEARLEALERESRRVRDMMLRIQGAIVAFGELLPPEERDSNTTCVRDVAT